MQTNTRAARLREAQATMQAAMGRSGRQDALRDARQRAGRIAPEGAPGCSADVPALRTALDDGLDAARHRLQTVFGNAESRIHQHMGAGLAPADYALGVSCLQALAACQRVIANDVSSSTGTAAPAG